MTLGLARAWGGQSTRLAGSLCMGLGGTSAGQHGQGLGDEDAAKWVMEQTIPQLRSRVHLSSPWLHCSKGTPTSLQDLDVCLAAPCAGSPGPWEVPALYPRPVNISLHLERLNEL